MADTSTLVAAPDVPIIVRDRTPIQAVVAYGRRNPQLVIGALMLLSLILICLVGPLFVNLKHAQPMSAIPVQPPSLRYPLGTDEHGRNLLAVMVIGLPLTLRIGLVAGAVGLGIGIVLGFLAGYRGGIVDAIIRMTVDMLLTVPSLLILTMIAASIRGFITIDIMALVIASLAWRGPTRTIRSQVLTLRERAYVQVARLSGMSDAQIIIRELVPNLLPYLAASFVSAVAYAILASIGLEALGLGPQNDPTLGMTIYWAIFFNALLRGFWWWWIPPILVLVILFLGLFLLTAGLDELANPRLRQQA